MMKKVKAFNVGDKVFAKVKGYPAWPAKIVAANGKKYEVSFYGTMETGSIKVEDLFYYLKHKDQFCRNLKRKDYQEAVGQIEAEIKDSGTDGNIDEESDTSVVSVEAFEKKGKKRKRESVSEDVETNKIHRSVSEDFESQESEEKSDENTNSEDVEVKSASQSVTRSGRIIKIKKFSDDEEEEVNKKSTKVVKASVASEQAHVEDEANDKDADVKQETTVVDAVAESPEGKVEPIESSVAMNEAKETVSPVEEVEEKESNTIPKEDEIVDVNIVPINYLETVIAYAEHVKSKEPFYKKKEVEPRELLENEVVIAKLPSNKLVGITYNNSTCDTEYEKAIDEGKEAKRVLSIKDKLESGSVTAQNEKDHLIMNLKVDEQNLEQKNDLKVMERKKTKLKYLKIEANLVDYDCKIKSCLGLDKAEPKKAYEYMDLMLELDISQLMLKKHPLIVDVMKRLRRYIGNVKEWKLAGDSLETFEADAEKIRQKAEEVFVKFISLFNATDAASFWEVFNTDVEKFEEETKDMNESELFALCAEPNSRQAFFDAFEDKRDAEKMERDKPTLEEKEKDNSSGDIVNSVQAVEVQESNIETP